MKVTHSQAQQLIEAYTNVYAQNRTEFVHVHEAGTRNIVLEVNVYKRYVKIYIDYARDIYVWARTPWDNAFIIKNGVLMVNAEGIQTCAIFAMEVVE